jgi:hypothetical protein
MDTKYTAKLLRRIEKYSIPEPNSGCWLWMGAQRGSSGYGCICFRGKTSRAHRVSWEAHKGPIPEGMNVLHKCDVRMCINPDHLFLGTQGDNMRDMCAKGRHVAPPGSRHGNSKLTESDVIAIRSSEAVHKVVAAQFGIDVNHVRLIRRGLRWGHI